MICHLCQEQKLSNEFPFYTLTEDCDHPILHCLRCATASVKNSKKCSQCEASVHEDSKQYLRYIETLKFLFPDVEAADDQPTDIPSSSEASGVPSNLMVTTLSGESTTIPYNPEQTVHSLKTAIAAKLGPPGNKQRLLYESVELKVFDRNHQLAKLKDYSVQPNSIIHLVIMLYAVPEGLDHVIFDFLWGYPESGRDYLDASVLLYSDNTFVEVIDFSHTAGILTTAIRHSGDVMDDERSLGHHTINVSLKSIPPPINKLVFTLSAWDSPNISKYPKPSLQFFDAKFPEEQLCDDQISHAGFFQAIIMCSLSKEEGQWQVFSLKTAASGNAKDYTPLQIKIAHLMSKGCL